MTLIIQDPEIDELATRLARITGQSVEAAVRQALRDQLARAEPVFHTDDQRARFEAIMEIGRRCAALPVLDDRSPDEIIGYDEHGLPR